MISRVRTSLTESTIPESKLGDIRTLGKTAIAKTRFEREDTLVTLKKLTLSEAFGFIQSQEQQPGVICSGIDLRTSDTSKDPSETDRWDIELTLTQHSEQVPQDK
ncbi:MAG: hypothetical protein ABL921_28215, partial [Pirellula sp.]